MRSCYPAFLDVCTILKKKGEEKKNLSVWPWTRSLYSWRHALVVLGDWNLLIVEDNLKVQWQVRRPRTPKWFCVGVPANCLHSFLWHHNIGRLSISAFLGLEYKCSAVLWVELVLSSCVVKYRSFVPWTFLARLTKCCWSYFSAFHEELEMIWQFVWDSFPAHCPIAQHMQNTRTASHSTCAVLDWDLKPHSSSNHLIRCSISYFTILNDHPGLSQPCTHFCLLLRHCLAYRLDSLIKLVSEQFFQSEQYGIIHTSHKKC